MINEDQNQTRYFRRIGVEYLKRLTLTQRIIRLIYLKYVYPQEQVAFKKEVENTAVVMIDDINEESRLESAMIEKQWYAQHYQLH